MKSIALVLSIIGLILLPIVAVNHKDGESMKPIYGAAWFTFVSACAYFGIRKEEKWIGSEEFSQRSKEFSEIIKVGMPISEAETIMNGIARLVKISDQKYFGEKYKNRKYRISEYEGNVSYVKILSYDGSVFEILSEPKKNGG
jgi:hypothetical protein